ncbi:MAG: hypothetical protein OQK75_05780 [Gammaproteobacteria bacterium]|nr:hypothetical protein [Gammaproteobacteria bacterium]MCW8987164.1 hypothetical protein [Gammaproteobacteria bacterium]
MSYLNQLEKMLDSGNRVIMMESFEVDRVCDLILELSRFSSKPYYLALPEKPMHRLGASHIGIPRTNTPEDLMEHIEASQHFGIYILRNYTEILEDNDMLEDLISIATGDTHKVVLMVSEYIKVPAVLKPYVARSKHQIKNAG